MLEALKTMQGDFLRRELFERVRSDETGIRSPNGTLSVVFCRLVEDKEIIATLPAIGNRPGRYKWAGGEEKPLTVSSTESV